MSLWQLVYLFSGLPIHMCNLKNFIDLGYVNNVIIIVFSVSDNGKEEKMFVR